MAFHTYTESKKKTNTDVRREYRAAAAKKRVDFEWTVNELVDGHWAERIMRYCGIKPRIHYRNIHSERERHNQNTLSFKFIHMHNESARFWIKTQTHKHTYTQKPNTRNGLISWPEHTMMLVNSQSFCFVSVVTPMCVNFNVGQRCVTWGFCYVLQPLLQLLVAASLFCSHFPCGQMNSIFMYVMWMWQSVHTEKSIYFQFFLIRLQL